MIPLRLVLRNFLSYAEPDPIDFTRFDIACLTGENGAGKSTLLDAMTFALFGAARGCEDGKNQERLIRDGTDDMLVEFTFELGGTTYRIERRRRRPTPSGRSTKGNEFCLEALTGEEWTSLAKESVRETQTYIQSLIRMDYRTFVTSAFFIQNRADEFLSRMTPDKRKDVFARLLDLEAYERLEAAARERSRAAERKRSALAEQADRLSAVAVDPSVLETELDAASTATEAGRAALRGAEEQAGRARSTVGQLEQEAAVLDGERRALDDLGRRLDAERHAVQTKKSEQDEIAKLLARTDEVRAALEETQNLRGADAAAREDHARSVALREQASALEERIRNERATIETRQAERRRSLAKLGSDIAAVEAAARDLSGVETALAELADIDSEIERATGELDERRRAEASAREQLAGIEANLANIDQKLGFLKEGDGTCPVCGEPLDAAHRRDLAREFRTARKDLTTARQRTLGERDLSAKEVRRLTEEIDRLRNGLRERGRLEAKSEALRVTATRLAETQNEIEKLTADAAQDDVLLASEEFAAPLRAELSALEARIAETYDAAAHGAVIARLDALRTYERLHGRLLEAQARNRLVAQELEDATVRTTRTTEEIEARRDAMETVAARIAGLGDAKNDLAALEAQAEAGRQRCAADRAGVARLEERLAAARRMATEVQAAREAEVEAAVQHRRYDMLATAFGRGGIPDRIIANAVPELADEANEILGRLSDYEMSLQFRMDKETKSGKVRETFDVLVHHDGGSPRDYSMFSGGEAFRIAFAVRLALSKLLVRRAGARLETLVIDEGFGTQDPGGRERLIEAINLARAEFACVLVITHLDDLKDVFGTQIRVWKDEPDGSRLQIVPA